MKQFNQLTDDEQRALQDSFLRDPDSFYEKAEMDQLREALQRTDKERFLMMTRLMRLNLMLSNARITYKPFTLSNAD